MWLRKVIFLFCIISGIVLFIDGALLINRYINSDYLNIGENINRYPNGKLHLESSMSKNSSVNLLILGLDEEGVRTDVILLVNFNPEASKVNILSIARDTKVFARGKYSKINSVYSAGKEVMVADVVKDITGLPIQYYMTLNFKGFRELIDVLGGVYFKVPFDMNYDDPTQNLHIHLHKGLQRLDGKKAEQLVRYRKGNTRSEGYIDGDIGRINMQQNFIRAVIKQKLNIKYLMKLDDIFTIFQKYMRTNFALSDFSYYLPAVQKVAAEDLKTFIIPGDSKMEGDIWYYIADEKETKDLIEKNFSK